MRSSDSVLVVQFCRIHIHFLEVTVELSLPYCYIWPFRLSIMRNMYFECWLNIARQRNCLFAYFDSSYTSHIIVTVWTGNTWTFFQESHVFLWSLLRKLSQGVMLKMCNLWVVDLRLISLAPRFSLCIIHTACLAAFGCLVRVCFKQTSFI